VHTYHGHVLDRYFSPRATRAIAAVERRLGRHTDRLVAIGSRVRDDLLSLEIGSPDRFVVMQPGVPPPEPVDRVTARRSLGLGAGIVVTFVGRLTEIKRPERFVGVATILAPKHRDTTFVIAGGGELLEALRVKSRALGDQVVFLGWRSDMATIYGASDVVVLTSDNEGMPVALIEAAAYGVPAVTTDVGSSREVVEHDVTGLVTGTSVPEIASAVERLLVDQEVRERMGARAAERARSQFSTERLVSETTQMYLDLCRQKGLLDPHLGSMF
jgi:glycosyltransferase involved in cell wall biosynthesis